MVAVHIDYPNEIVHWFSGRHDVPAIGPCMHRCPHNQTATIAWGPDTKHYELVQCDVEEGCNHLCRAWQNPQGKITTEWLSVGDVNAAGTC
jgi:hypothetical protein